MNILKILSVKLNEGDESRLNHRLSLALIKADVMTGMGNTESGSEEDSYEEITLTPISHKRNRGKKRNRLVMEVLKDLHYQQK